MEAGLRLFLVVILILFRLVLSGFDCYFRLFRLLVLLLLLFLVRFCWVFFGYFVCLFSFVCFDLFAWLVGCFLLVVLFVICWALIIFRFISFN